MNTAVSTSSTHHCSSLPLEILTGVTGGENTLHCPFVTSLNSFVAVAEKRGLEWAERFNLLSSRMVLVAGKLEYVRFSAFVHPYASLEALQIVGDFFTWLFLLDDVWDESMYGTKGHHMALLHERFMEILHGAQPAAQDDPFTHALYDLRTRIETFGSEAILARFSKSAHAYFKAGQWEAMNRARGVVPDVQTYLAARMVSGAVYPCFDLIAITDHCDLPEPVLQHETVRRLSTLANRVISWCNDIYSVDKERQHHDVHNLVLVLQHEGQLPFDAAVSHAVRIHNQDVADFLALAARLPTFGRTIDAQLTRYVNGLRTWMRANYEFSRTAARYRVT